MSFLFLLQVDCADHVDATWGARMARNLGSRDGLVVKMPDSWTKGRGFKSWWQKFLLHGQLSVLSHISVSIPPPFYCSST